MRTAWQRLSLRRKGVLILAILILPLLVAILTLFVQTQQDAAADAEITATRRTREAAEMVLDLAIDAETSIRGYVATGNPEFLETYWEVLADRESLGDLIDQAEIPSAALELLKEQYRLLEQLRTKSDAMSPEQREAVLLEGKANMDEIRAALRAHIDVKEDELNTALDYRQDLHRRTTLTLWLGGIAGLLGGSLGITLFVRDIAGRVTLLQENSRRIDGTAPLEPIRGGDEIGALGRVLEETRQALMQKEALRRDAEVEMMRSRDEAERANRAKSEFLSRMSHELRTPLNSILGFAQLLEMDHLNEDQKDSIRHIVKGGRHLLDLINEVLDIARIEAGHLSLSMEPVEFVPLIEESVALMEPLAAHRDIDLRVAFPESLAGCHVIADRQRLKQIVLNLMSNGIKYNRPAGSVTLTGTDLGDRLRLEVTDSGLGLSAPDLEGLFTPFGRLGAERLDVEGTGLGLALSKRLAEAMGSDIEVVSEVGKGSSFALHLPKAVDPLFQETAAAPPAEAVAPPASGRATVLYIEDNLSNLKLVESVLAHRPGVDLISAMQGRLGIDLARQHSPDLILLDLNLPDVSGGEVLRMLRSDPRTASIPVVMVSADATPGQVERFRSAGIVHYLTKPLDVAEFLRVVDEIIVEGVA
ncbi:MAG: ATP-binding protein [Actinomycetota bacterium]|nr:ATP-binding protein [Actinomycetota bacterium]